MEIKDLSEQYLSKFGKEVSNRYKNGVEWIEWKLLDKESKKEEKVEVVNVAPIEEGSFTLIGADGKEKTRDDGTVRMFKVFRNKTIEIC